MALHLLHVQEIALKDITVWRDLLHPQVLLALLGVFARQVHLLVTHIFAMLDFMEMRLQEHLQLVLGLALQDFIVMRARQAVLSLIVLLEIIVMVLVHHQNYATFLVITALLIHILQPSTHVLVVIMAILLD